MGVNSWNAKNANTTSVYGLFFKPKVVAFQKAHRLTGDGIIGQATWKALWPHLNEQARALLIPPLLLCYPNPDVPGCYVGQNLHRTSGIPGSWALDFMAHGGTPVLASYDGVITKLSGHDPKTGTHGKVGDVFGWSVYLKDSAGRVGYLTHMGSRTCKVGDKVKVGQKIGTVGKWPHDPGRSHTHFGITSPAGEKDAKDRITSISKATRIPAL